MFQIVTNQVSTGSEVYCNISGLSPEYFPGIIRSEIHRVINKDNSILFPCDCDCFDNTVEVVISPVGVEDLTYSFDYSLEYDALFPEKKLEKYFHDIVKHD